MALSLEDYKAVVDEITNVETMRPVLNTLLELIDKKSNNEQKKNTFRVYWHELNVKWAPNAIAMRTLMSMVTTLQPDRGARCEVCMGSLTGGCYQFKKTITEGSVPTPTSCCYFVFSVESAKN